MELTQRLRTFKEALHPVPEQRAHEPAVLVLSILYLVGIAGILLPIHPDFILLTPANLLVSTAILLWYHAPAWNLRTWAFIALTYFVGFFAEVFGVQTGLLFGHYTYGKVLGWKLWGTPLMIGVNWILLTYCSGIMMQMLFPKLHRLVRAFLGALAMVLLDMLIEPMAVKYDMWSWQGAAIPIQNYFGWFVIAFPLQWILTYWLAGTRNKVAIPLFIWQVLFFLALNIADRV